MHSSLTKVSCRTWPRDRICSIQIEGYYFQWVPFDEPSASCSIELERLSVQPAALDQGRLDLVADIETISIYGAQPFLEKWLDILVSAQTSLRRRRNAPAISHKRPKSSVTLCGISFEFDAHYQPIKALGRGTFGYVISVRDSRTGLAVALKKVHHAFKHRNDATRMIREIQVMGFLNHRNVLGIYDVLMPSHAEFQDVYFAMPLMSTDLQRVIKSSQPMGLSHYKHIMYQLLCGLNYIHSAGVVHRDLKPANVLANGDCAIQICDFGLCRELDGGPLSVSVVTRWYRAPEILLGCDDYGTAVDMWSAGCILAELLLRTPLLPGSSSLDQMARILRLLGTPTPAQLGFLVKPDARRFMAMQPQRPGVSWVEAFPSVHPLVLNLLTKLLQFDPRARPSAAEALQHPLFADIRDAKAERTAPARFRFAHSRADLSSAQLRQLVVREAARYCAPPPPDAADAADAASTAVAASGGDAATAAARTAIEPTASDATASHAPAAADTAAVQRATTAAAPATAADGTAAEAEATALNAAAKEATAIGATQVAAAAQAAAATCASWDTPRRRRRRRSRDRIGTWAKQQPSGCPSTVLAAAAAAAVAETTPEEGDGDTTTVSITRISGTAAASSSGAALSPITATCTLPALL